jgi:TonB family protein
MPVGVRGRDLPWTPLAASVAIHAIVLAALAAPEAGRRTPVAAMPTVITASLAGVRMAGEVAPASPAPSPAAAVASGSSDARRTRPVATPVRAEAPIAAPASATRTSESASSTPSIERPAPPAVAPDDDIADAGRYRMVFAFAMRRAVTAELPAASQRVRVLLALAFDAAGALAVEVLGSSGSPALDAQAVSIARAAHAAAPVPPRLRGTSMRFNVTVELAEPAPAVVAG